MTRKTTLTAVLALGLFTGGCAGMDLDRFDDSGLAAPPGGTGIPEPHTGADDPSRMLTKLTRPQPRREDYPVPKPK
ncbi:MAG: hypothetical protein GC145_01750 [Caulobacter sp.]|nr:hypothetical protein [Caulobacter sp.]